MAKTERVPDGPSPRGGGQTPLPICFIDAKGGAFAALAAGIERARGHGEVIAATTSPVVGVPAEIGAVLAEIGVAVPEVVLAAGLPRHAERVDLASWPLALHEGDGDLERLAVARIARDRIERRLIAGV